jgi:cobalt-zinc-cadmium efflux system outer membrane protein
VRVLSVALLEFAMNRTFQWCLVFVALVIGASRVLAQPHAKTSDSAPSREITLAELEAFARGHSPRLRVARSRERLGVGARAAASALFSNNPELELAVGPRWIGGADRVSYDFSAGLSQPVDLAGGRGARQRAAQRFDERLGAETELTDFELRIELASAYRSAQLARAQRESAQKSLEFVSEALRIVERRLTAGDSTLIERRVAEGDLARTRRDLSLAEQALREASLRLCELSGWPSSAPPLVAAALPELRHVPPIEALLETAARRHPELRVRNAVLAQARAEVDLAERGGWPAPAFGAQLSREGGREGESDWIVLGTLRVSLPLWQRNRAEREQSAAERAIAQAELNATAESLVVRIRRAAGELAAAAERLQLMAASSEAFADSLGLLRRGLEAGELALLDVSVARERFLAAEVAALSARADYEQAWLELERATGEPLGNEL